MRAVLSVRRFFPWVAFALFAAGCQDAGTKACLAQYESAQQLVLKVQARERESVSESLRAVESALTACRAANRHGEVDQLTKAQNELSAQLSLLDRRARRKSAKPSPEELRRLEREGDPTCPRGQAYRQGGSKEIRCTGPVLVDMTFPQVKAHFEEQDFLVRTPSENTLEVERGAERYRFVYAPGKREAPATCVVLTPPPGLPWREALARATGERPGRLKNPGSVKTAAGERAYTVDEDKVIVRLGDCST